MKKYDLENKYVLTETDETTGAQRIIGTGDDADEYDKFYSLSDDENDIYTLYIPRDDGSVFIIERVTWLDADYEDDGFILYQKKNENDDELNFVYLFEENRIIELGSEEDNGFYINQEEGKKLAAYICDNELVYFSFISFFMLDDEYFFETEPGKFRIFSTASYGSPEEETKQPFHSVDDDENGVTIFFERDGELYREIIRTENQIQFHNAYLTQNEVNGRYELYGFKEGKPFLLGSGNIFEEINGNIRLDKLIWRETSEDEWLLEYEPDKYEEPKPEPESEPEPHYETRNQNWQSGGMETNEPKVTVHGLDDSRYFGAGNKTEKEKKPWWKLW